MTRSPTPPEVAEVQALILSLMDQRTVISRGYIEDAIAAEPDRFPELSSIPILIRRDMISQIMNRRFYLLNQTAQRPKSRVWVLNSPKQEVACVSC